MNTEVKVGQVWNDPYFGEIKVVAKENDQVVFQKVDGNFIVTNIKNPGWVKCLTFIRDVEIQLSDLEIVQKALFVTGTTLIMTDGEWQIKAFNESVTDVVAGGSMQSLLTWAKKTIGARADLRFNEDNVHKHCI